MVFQKLSASGNDFLIFHAFSKLDYSNLAKNVCDRRYGFGADGLIVLIPNDKYDYEWLFYNSDGSEANMCGNGARAAAIYAYTNKLANAKHTFLSKAGAIAVEVFEDFQAEVTLTKPKTISKNIDGYFKIDTGVLHLTKLVNDINDFDIPTLRQLRHRHDANINHFAIIGDEVFVRTYERGVEDETLACGTGMAACVWNIMENEQLFSKKFKIRAKSNELLQIYYDNERLKLKGLVSIVGSCSYEHL